MSRTPSAIPDHWDRQYLFGAVPWETGRPSSELVRVVAEAPVRPCRAVELGCGTGASAVWLAPLPAVRHGWEASMRVPSVFAASGCSERVQFLPWETA